MNDSTQLHHRIFTCSPWVEERCIANPELLKQALDSNTFQQIYTKETYQQQLKQLTFNDFAQFSKKIRIWRTQAMLRIIWRNCAGWASLYETIADLSAMADAAIYFAEFTLFTWLSEKYGVPFDQQGNPQHLLIIALGKLGGEELNLSSDVDLLFAYEHEGELVSSGLTYGEFYQRLAQQFIKLLNEITAEGFVFRVDMRLRPYGDSGPLVMSFAGLENYYQAQGREWERYALIKARPITGSIEAQQEFMSLIRPFVYRRYVDYTVLQALREMYALIMQENQRKNLQEHLKLGAGGIRSIEFIVQMHQLIRGGREPVLQQPHFFNAINQLRLLEISSPEITEDLRQAYVFLRITEHALQAVHDQQTHSLPHSSEEKERLIYALGFATWADFYQELEKHRKIVKHYFSEYAEPPAVGGVTALPASALSPLVQVWSGKLEETAALNELKKIGFVEPQPIYTRLRYYAEHPQCRHLSPQAQQRLLAFVPVLLIELTKATDPFNTLTRTFDIVMAVVKRSAYLVLLLENPKALQRLVFLCGASSWVSHELVLHPLLLDELLDERTWARVPSTKEVINELQKALDKVASDDTEQQMDTLRHIKHINFFRVAVTEIHGFLNATQASLTLSMIARVIVQVVFILVLRQQMAKLSKKKLVELSLVNELWQMRNLPFAIIAYGKLASLELNYTSDLDLVFIYATVNLTPWGIDLNEQDTHEFFLRVAKRMMHWLNTPTNMGVLFRVDTRLQPEGSAGLLVSEWQSFADYQQERTWIWEQQAMVSARMIYGPLSLRRKFRQLRRKILCQPRQLPDLSQEIIAMRTRMQQYAKSSQSGITGFNLKTDPGGMVDVEFIIQYAVLGYAARYPELIKYTDIAHLCSELYTLQILNKEQVNNLRTAYNIYKERAHQLALQNLPTVVGTDEYQEWRQKIKDCWSNFLKKE